MGQQQLIILVLAALIVSIALFVGMNQYQKHDVRSNWDALMRDGIAIANDAQQWKIRPEFLGGSPDATKQEQSNYVGITFGLLNYTPEDISGSNLECYTNLNGVFELTPSADGLTITGHSMTHRNQSTIQVLGIIDGNITLSETAEDQVLGGISTIDQSEQEVTPPSCASSFFSE